MTRGVSGGRQRLAIYMYDTLRAAAPRFATAHASQHCQRDSPPGARSLRIERPASLRIGQRRLGCSTKLVSRARCLQAADARAASLHRDFLTSGQGPCFASIRRGLSRPLCAGKPAHSPRRASRRADLLGYQPTRPCLTAVELVILNAGGRDSRQRSIIVGACAARTAPTRRKQGSGVLLTLTASQGSPLHESVHRSDDRNGGLTRPPPRRCRRPHDPCRSCSTTVAPPPRLPGVRRPWIAPECAHVRRDPR